MSSVTLDEIMAEITQLKQRFSVHLPNEPLTREQAAEYLKVAPARIDKLRRARKIGYIALAGGEEEERAIRYLRGDLDAYVASLRCGVQ